MITKTSFKNARHAVIFLPLLGNPKVPTQAVLDLLNQRDMTQGMCFVSREMEYPAVGAIVMALEKIPEIKEYFMKTPSADTVKFRQFIGMAVRLKMEENGYRKTGKKGSIGSFSKWLTRAEIYEVDE